MLTLLAALAASALTALFGWGGRALAAPSEVAENDRLAAERNADLETWVDDTTRAIEERDDGIDAEWRKEFNARVPAPWGRRSTNPEKARAREQALHRYRDEERRARRDITGLRARETWVHTVWRKARRRPPPTLEAAKTVQQVLDYWRRPVGGGDSPEAVRDPTRRTIADTLAELPGHTSWDPEET